MEKSNQELDEYEWTALQLDQLRRSHKQYQRMLWFEKNRTKITYCLCIASFCFGCLVGVILSR